MGIEELVKGDKSDSDVLGALNANYEFQDSKLPKIKDETIRPSMSEMKAEIYKSLDSSKIMGNTLTHSHRNGIRDALTKGMKTYFSKTDDKIASGIIESYKGQDDEQLFIALAQHFDQVTGVQSQEESIRQILGIAERPGIKASAFRDQLDKYALDRQDGAVNYAASLYSQAKIGALPAAAVKKVGTNYLQEQGKMLMPGANVQWAKARPENVAAAYNAHRAGEGLTNYGWKPQVGNAYQA